MADYKQLCAELVDDLELCDWPFKLKETIRADIDRARAALAEPEPKGPTDEELDELAWNWYSKTGSTWWQIEAFRALARAVLARWGK